MSEDDGLRRPSTASIDRRVERLEQAQAETDRKVDRLELGLAHLREVMNARLSTIDASIGAESDLIKHVDSKIDNLVVFIQTQLAEATKVSGDLTATPAGRLVAERFTEIEDADKSHDERITALEHAQWRTMGALSVLVTILIIVAPYIRTIFHIPS